jgi:hypothetical protein
MGSVIVVLPTYSTSTSSGSASATDSPLVRQSGALATREQIDAACVSNSNAVFNEDFELEDDNNALGWAVKPDDAFISFRTYPSDDQHTPSGRRSGRVLSAAPGRKVAISTPVTLCPGQQYKLSSFNRQANLLAQCTVTYAIGDDTIYTASPQEVWLEAPKSEFYTAGDTPEDVSVDLSTTVECAGQGGAPAGTDDDGFMVVEFDDVSLTKA